MGLLLQVEGVNLVWPESGCDRLDEMPVQVTAGGSVEVGAGVRAFLGFSEDVTRSAPDFSVWLGVSVPAP